jgi:drug/metabolite transporter (DMT)-like permease
VTSSPNRSVWLGTLALAAGASCIALAPIMVKLSPVGPQASAFWRLAIALPLLLVWAHLERRGASTQKPGDWRWMQIAGLLFALDLITWHAGIVRTSAANATFLSNLTPIVVVAFMWISTRTLPQRLWFIAVGFALFGSLMLSGGAPGLDQTKLTGDALGALTAVWYGLYLLVIAGVRERVGAGRIMLVSSSVAASICLVVTLASGEALLPAHNGAEALSTWWPLLVLGIVSHVGGQGLLAVGFGLVPTHIASVLILLQPVLVGFIGWLWLGEALGPIQIAGAVLVLVGVWLAKRSG